MKADGERNEGNSDRCLSTLRTVTERGRICDECQQCRAAHTIWMGMKTMISLANWQVNIDGCIMEAQACASFIIGGEKI